MESERALMFMDRLIREETCRLCDSPHTFSHPQLTQTDMHKHTYTHTPFVCVCARQSGCVSLTHTVALGKTQTKTNSKRGQKEPAHPVPQNGVPRMPSKLHFGISKSTFFSALSPPELPRSGS
jgi:hypothetical protein